MVRLKADPTVDPGRMLEGDSFRQESSVGSGFSQTWSNQ
jgi:proline racemase